MGQSTQQIIETETNQILYQHSFIGVDVNAACVDSFYVIFRHTRDNNNTILVYLLVSYPLHVSRKNLT
jgi:hypothetical protein